MHTERSQRLPTTLNRSATTGVKHKALRFASTTPDRRIFAAVAENPSLGPGSYEVKSTLRLNEGFSFPVHGNEDDNEKDPITGFRFSYLDNPGPGYYPQYTPLDPKGYSFPSALSKRGDLSGSPGPGQYYLTGRIVGLGHFFSPNPRFELTPIERLAAYTPRLHNISKEEKERIKRRIEDNKDVSRFYPKERAKSLQRLANSHAKKLDLTKSIKQLIDEEKHQIRLSRLDEKISKMELRLNSHEVRLVKKTWIYCIVMVSSASIMHLRLTNFQAHRLAVRGYLRLWASVTIFVVRFLYQIRKRRYKKHLRTLFKPLGKQWLMLYIQPMRERVTEVAEYYLVQSMLKKLLERWRKSKLFIQEHVKAFLNRRKKLIDQVMTKLKKVEADALNPVSLKSRIFPDISVAKMAFEAVSVAARQREISRHIALRVQSYLSSLRTQQEAVTSFQQFIEIAITNRKYIEDYEINWSDAVSVPDKPRLCLDFSRKELEAITLELASRNQSFNVLPKPRRNTKHFTHLPSGRSRAPSKHHR